MKKYILHFSLIIFSVVFGAGQEVLAQGSLQNAINQHIQKEAKAEEAVEYKEARKIVMGDLDGDGDKDAVVQYTLEGFGGGNNWSQLMAVFVNQKGVYKFAGEEPVGGKFFTYTSTLSRILNGRIILNTETCSEPPQGMCENPKKGVARFSLKAGKLSKA